MKDKILNSTFSVGNIIFAAALIILLPLRLLQHLNGTLEPKTGFFAEYNFSVYAFFAVLIASIIAIIVYGFIQRKAIGYSLEKIKRPGFGIVSALLAASLIIDIFTCYGKLITLAPTAPVEEITPEYTTYYILYIQIAFSLLAAMYLVVIFIGSVTGKSTACEFRVLSLAPVFWSMSKLVIRFLRTISFIRVSELLFEMTMLAFTILFFMTFAQCNSKVNDKLCQWKLAAYGLPAAILSLLCFVPRLILTVVGKDGLVYSDSVIEFTDCAVAVFIIATVATRLIPAPPAQEAPENEAPDAAEEIQKSEPSEE